MEPREQTAQRLLESSLRHSYDPDLEIDWAAPLDPDAFWLPPHRSSLYNTPLWNQMTHAQRVELTKHEVISAASTGIWFETILMQMLIRHYYDQDPTTDHAQYALTEVADECRHSIMFGRLISAAGCTPYPASWKDQMLGRYMKATAKGAHMFAAILIAEEILDSFQREIMVDDTLQPLIRMVSRIHVVEEARHVRYAREELVRQVEMAKPIPLAYARIVIGRAALTIAERLIHPDIYRAVGIEPTIGQAAANANKDFGATLRWSGQKVVAFLSELGLIAGPAKNLWRRSRLI
jgi:hypothetical protein